jgi:kinesin family member 21
MGESCVVDVASEDNTITLGADKLFSFDATFDQNSKQEEVFDKCVRNLVLGCFQGFNATVLAYG